MSIKISENKILIKKHLRELDELYNISNSGTQRNILFRKIKLLEKYILND